MARKQPKEGWRIKNAYTIRQAARLAGTSPATVRRWLHGYDQPGHTMKPVFGEDLEGTESAAIVSFLQLAEIVVVAAFRSRLIPLERLRRAHSFAEEQLGLSYPFATHNFKTDGAHILHEFNERQPVDQSLLALDMRGQWVMPITVTERIDRFDFDKLWAVRWFPEGREIPIVIDPRVAGGKPTVANKGVRVAIIYGRYRAGESVEFIAADFGIKPESVEVIVNQVQTHEERYAA